MSRGELGPNDSVDVTRDSTGNLSTGCGSHRAREGAGKPVVPETRALATGQCGTIVDSRARRAGAQPRENTCGSSEHDGSHTLSTRLRCDHDRWFLCTPRPLWTVGCFDRERKEA
jgi:hypothetical protein